VRAFVFSGGSVLGSAQVGAARALLEHHLRPELLVGVSAGALNATFLAREVSLAQVERLAAIWRIVTRADVYPGTHFEVGWRLCAGEDSLFDSRNFYRFLQQQGIQPATTFGELCDVPALVTATHLHTGQLRLFGTDPADRVLDALMASTALPPLHAPWMVQGERYVDGGMVTPLPLRVALAHGATEIYALHVLDDTSAYSGERTVHGVPGMLVRSISMAMQHLAKYDLLLAIQTPRVQVHEIQIVVPNTPDVTDFSHADRLCEIGYQAATAYLRRTTVHHRLPATPTARTVTPQTGVHDEAMMIGQMSE
jgi:NTE family protein